MHVTLGAFLAFFLFKSGHAQNENFDKYFLVSFSQSKVMEQRQ